MASSLMSVRVNNEGEAEIRLTKKSQRMLSGTYKLLKALSFYDTDAAVATETLLKVAVKHQEG